MEKISSNGIYKTFNKIVVFLCYTIPMNYYLVQTQYFLIFIIVGCTALSSIPFIKNSFANFSDTYLRSHLSQIQSEFFFMSDFKGACSEGNTGALVQELYYHNRGKVICRTNPPASNQVVICGESSEGSFYCIDGVGTRCEFPYLPASGHNCKQLI